MLVLSAAQPVTGDNNELLVFSVAPPSGVYQNNYTPTSNTDADDHLHYGAWARRESMLQGPPGSKVDVGTRP